MFNLGVGCDQILESQVSRVAQTHSEGNDWIPTVFCDREIVSSAKACKPSCHFSVLCSHSELEDLAEKVRCVLCSQQKILSLITDVKFSSKSLLYHSLRIPVLILYACYLFELELQNKY